MTDIKAERIKELIASKVKEAKGEIPYSKISEKCNTTAARISDVANNNIDCQLTTFIDIAIGLRIHPRDLMDISFDFDEFYAQLDGKLSK